MLLEEVFVTDAPALYMSRDRSGRLKALLPLDGATIKPVIDPWGRPPQPYYEDGKLVYPAAYQQILKGYPAIDYSMRDLIYRPRNLRVNRVYGMSPVEQVVTTVNIALRRQLYLLDYFSEGNIPDSLIGVPESWTPDQIASYQKYWDAYFDGDLSRRRRAKFVPGGVAKTFIQTKEPELKGPFDEWLARIVCFAFSISPRALTQTVNRATAETQKELRRRGLGANPCLGEGTHRRYNRERIRRARSRIRLEHRERNRSRGASGSPLWLYVEGYFDHQRGARRAWPGAARGGVGE
jgi:hypothetical protein